MTIPQYLCIICIRKSADKHWVLSSFSKFLCKLCRYSPKWQTHLYAWNPTGKLTIVNRKTSQNLRPKAPNTPNRWPGVDGKTGNQMFTSAIAYVGDANFLSNCIAVHERPTKSKQPMWQRNQDLVLTHRGPRVQGPGTAKGKTNQWTSRLWFKSGPNQKWPISTTLQCQAGSCHLSFSWACPYQNSTTHRLSTPFSLRVFLVS